MTSTFTQIGGARISFINATWPLALLSVQRDSIALRCLFKFTFPRDRIIGLSMICRFLDDGDLWKLHWMLIRTKPPAPSVRSQSGSRLPARCAVDNHGANDAQNEHDDAPPAVCTENLIRVDAVMESPKLAE
jgi:hypothetical protein